MRHRTFVKATCVSTALAITLVGCGADSPGGNGECRSNILVGDLVISEIYADAPSVDEGNEWFEIYNASSETFNLEGLSLVASDQDAESIRTHRMGSIEIAPGQYLVVGGVLEEFRPSYMDYGYAADLGALRNTNGRLALACGSEIIDETTYAETSSGQALQLSGSITPDHVANDNADNFCDESQNAFVTDQFGTPQAANDSCGPVNPNECTDESGARATVKPTADDIEISEYMARPSAVTAANGEWIELRILGNIDLNGLQLGRAEPEGEDEPGPGSVRDTISSADCITAGPGDYIVLARNTDIAENGGVAADLSLNFGLTDDDDGVFIGIDGTPLDVVTWSSNPAGTAIQIDSEGNASEASCPYGDGDLGTPGVDNSLCSISCNDGGEDRPVSLPDAGQVTISEWMPNPGGADGDKQWLEVAGPPGADLNGLVVSIPGKTTFTLASADCLEIDGEGFFVIAESDEPTFNNDIPQVDYVQASLDFFNSDDAGEPRTFSLLIGGAESDAASYLDTTSGAAIQIAQDDAQCDATVAYGDGTDDDLGTPGAANDATCI